MFFWKKCVVTSKKKQTSDNKEKSLQAQPTTHTSWLWGGFGWLNYGTRKSKRIAKRASCFVFFFEKTKKKRKIRSF